MKNPQNKLTYAYLIGENCHCKFPRIKRFKYFGDNVPVGARRDVCLKTNIRKIWFWSDMDCHVVTLINKKKRSDISSLKDTEVYMMWMSSTNCILFACPFLYQRCLQFIKRTLKRSIKIPCTRMIVCILSLLSCLYFLLFTYICDFCTYLKACK